MSVERERNGGGRLDRSHTRSRSRSRSPASRGRGRGGGGGGGGRGKSTGDEQKMVYISNIPFDVRWMELKDLVREKAGDVAFVEVIEKDGKSKGCAVVEFKDKESAKKCVETMHRSQVKDRYIVVKEIREPERFFKKVKEETGVDFLANKSGPQSVIHGNNNSSNNNYMPANYETYGLSPVFLKQLGIDGPLCNRVFVANLSFTVGPSKLKEVFMLAGQVTDVDIQLDKEGKSKGLAVIEYSHPIEAVQAISMLHNQKYHDRTMTVKMDRFDKPLESRRPGELPLGLKSIGMGLGGNGTPLTNIAQLVSSGAFGGGSSSSNSFGSSLLGGNSGLGSGLDSGRIFNSSIGSLGGGGGGSSNLSSSLGSNAFGNSSFGASNLGGGGSSLYGSGGGGQSMNSFGGGGGGGGGSSSALGGYGGGNISNMDSYRGSGSLLGAGDFDRYGRSMSPPRQLRLSRAVILRNLPHDYSWQTLRDRMRGFGEVEFSDIIQAGVGKVRFKTAADAEKAAVSLHGMIVEGRQIAADLAASD